MNNVEVFRSFLIFCYLMSLWQFAWFIWRYITVIDPLKDKVAAGELIAPPKHVTLEYHLNVCYSYVVLTFAAFYNISQDRPLNPFSLALMPAIIWMFFILRRFRRYYEDRLRAWTSVESEG